MYESQIQRRGEWLKKLSSQKDNPTQYDDSLPNTRYISLFPMQKISVTKEIDDRRVPGLNRNAQSAEYSTRHAVLSPLYNAKDFNDCRGSPFIANEDLTSL